MATDRKRGPFDDEFERGYVPADEPPGMEEGEYKRWKEAGGKIVGQPPVARDIDQSPLPAITYAQWLAGQIAPAVIALPFVQGKDFVKRRMVADVTVSVVNAILDKMHSKACHVAPVVPRDPNVERWSSDQMWGVYADDEEGGSPPVALFRHRWHAEAWLNSEQCVSPGLHTVVETEAVRGRWRRVGAEDAPTPSP